LYRLPVFTPINLRELRFAASKPETKVEPPLSPGQTVDPILGIVDGRPAESSFAVVTRKLLPAVAGRWTAAHPIV
jgi:hypothetical protein